MKKNIIFVIAIALLLLIVSFLVINKYSNRNRLIELDVNQVLEKVDNKDSFVLCISRTDCSFCEKYKPKLAKISKDYKVEIYYIDIDKYSKEEQQEFIKHISFDKSTPVTAFIKDGVETTSSNRIFGNVSSDKIVDKLIKNGFIEKN